MSEFDEAKKLLESTGHLVVEKREKKTFDTFMTYLMDQNGRCSADGGDHTFYCLKLNDENFLFGSLEGFRAQIKEEGLYDWAYVAGIIPNEELEKTGGKVPVTWLPIFGNRERYVTKWLQNGSPSGAVAEIFRDRRMKVKDRIDYFSIPAEEQLSLNELKEELEKLGLPCRIRSNRKGDYLETNLEFSQEACKKWNDIPISSGYRTVDLIRNKFVINKHKFNSVQKVVDYFKENKGLYELAEAKETINKSGKKLIKEAIDEDSINDMIERLNWRKIGNWKFHLDGASEDNYFSIVAEDQTGEKDGVEWVWFYVDGEVNVYYWFDNIQDREVSGIDSIRKLFDLISTDRNLEELNESAKVNESKEYSFDKIMKITELLYDNIEDLRYDDARDIAEYVSEKMESRDVDNEYVAETLEQILDDCGIRIHFDLASILASKILGL